MSYEAYPQLASGFVEKEEVTKEGLEEKEKSFDLDLLSAKKEFEVEELPEFHFKYKKRKGLLESVGSALLNIFKDEYGDVEINARVFGLDDVPEVVYLEGGEFEIKLGDKRQFRPGKNKLSIKIKDGDEVFIEEIEFMWGVLALNVDRSIYAPGTEAYVQMGVLDTFGHTICDADIALTVTSAVGVSSYYSTQNNTVLTSGECSGDSYVEVPDYFVYYPIPQDIGVYEIRFAATTKEGTHTITDTFEVQDDALFDIERRGPTRIYPPEKYTVGFTVTSESNFSGIIEEKVPLGFRVFQPLHGVGYKSVREENGVQII